MEFEKNLDEWSPKRVKNPSAVEGGSPQESADEAYERTSDRLRHRGRSVSLWDYERMVLEEFPTIYKVGVFAGIVGSLALVGWMLSDLKGPRNGLGQDPDLSTATDTALPISATPDTENALEPATATPTPSVTPSATSTPTSSPTPTARPIEINFNADSYRIVQGECTTLRWRVVGADVVQVLGAEVEHTEAEQVCPASSTSYRLVAENAGSMVDSSFLIEVLVPTDTEEPLGCTGYDNNGQLVCKESCTDNDPKDPCSLE